jgi:HD-like signal output (HDOD) protein
MERITRVIETDPALCAKLLQLVNSSFFANRFPTTDMHAAVTRLGVGTLKTLVLSLEAMDNLKPRKNLREFSVTKQSAHSQVVARITAACYEEKQARAQAFMAGMLHDIGKWVLASAAPDMLKQAHAHAQEEGLPFHVAERALFGATHAELGAYLIGMWGLPTPVVGAIAHHHSLERLESSVGAFPLTNGLFVAEAVADGDELEDDLLGRLGCPLKLDELQRLRDEPEATV